MDRPCKCEDSSNADEIWPGSQTNNIIHIVLCSPHPSCPPWVTNSPLMFVCTPYKTLSCTTPIHHRPFSYRGLSITPCLFYMMLLQASRCNIWYLHYTASPWDSECYTTMLVICLISDTPCTSHLIINLQSEYYISRLLGFSCWFVFFCEKSPDD